MDLARAATRTGAGAVLGCPVGTQFVPYLQRCQQSGIGFTTMADLGDTAECRRALYELDQACSADIPGQGAFYTFDEYVEQRMKPQAMTRRPSSWR